MKTLVRFAAISAVALVAGAGVARGSAEAQPVQADPAGAPVSRAAQCFSMRDWRSWRAVNDRAMHVRVFGKGVYRLEFAGTCDGLDWSGAQIVTQAQRGFEVCEPDDLYLGVSVAGGGVNQCRIARMTLLTPEQVAALPRKQRP